MTIYYVNPVSGSNANAGTSWGAAWKYLPGNGTAILPGDEIRYAKSPTTTAATSLTSGTTLTLPTALYSFIDVAATWTGVAGLTTNTSDGIALNSGVSVPANTKLGYRAVSFTNTTHRGIAITVNAIAFPFGLNKYLKVCLCSDTAGNTPVVTLTGPTLSTTDSAGTTMSVFTYNSPSTLNITIQSIAFYSVDAFTAPSAITAIARTVYGICFTPDQAGSDFYPAGTAVATSAPAVTPTVTYPAPKVYGVYRYLGQTAALASAAPDLVQYGTTVTATPLKYAALPVSDAAEAEATVSFSGSAGQPVKVSGGWNPASGLQDGYTNVFPSIGRRQDHGFLRFSAGGDYLEFDHFLAPGCAMVSYLYVTAAAFTLASLKFVDCALPGATTSADVAPIMVKAINDNLTVTALSFIRCMCTGPVVAARHYAGTSTTSLYALFTARQLKAGTVLWEDCSFSSFTGAAPLCATSATIQGTVANAASVYSGGSVTVYQETGSFLLGPVTTLSNIALTGSLANANTPASGSITAADLLLASYGSAGTVALTGYDVALNGLSASSGFSTVGLTLTGLTVAASNLSNPPQASVSGLLSLTGSTVLTISASTLELLEMDYTFSGTNKPVWSLSGVMESVLTGLAVASVTAFEGSMSSFPFRANIPGIEIHGSTLQVLPASLPDGLLRLYGCTIQNSPIVGYRSYGCTFTGTTTLIDTDTTAGPGRHVGANGGGATIASAAGATYQGSVVVDSEASSPFLIGNGTSGVEPCRTFPHVSRIQGKFQAGHYGGHMRRTVDVLNAFGQYDVEFKHLIQLSRLAVAQNVGLTLVLRVRATASGFLRLILPPGPAFRSTIENHVIHRRMVSTTEDTIVTFSFVPTADGLLDVYLFSSVDATLRSFSVALS